MTIKAAHRDTFMDILVDIDDYERLKDIKWHIHNGYARGLYHGRKQFMHRVVLGLTEFSRDTHELRQVDHLNRNRLDNRKHNLRIVTRQEQNRNREYAKQPSFWYEAKQDRWVAAGAPVDGGRYKRKIASTREEAEAISRRMRGLNPITPE